MSNLSAPLRWGITATAVVVAVALGAALLNVNRNQGVASVAPTASPTPVATPVATPAPSATLLTLRSAPAAACRAGETLTGCMKAGTYALSPDVVAGGASLDVPSGWFEWDPGMGSEGVLVDEPDAPDGSGWGLLFIVPGSVSRDPCDSKAGTYPAGAAVGSVDELVAAMSSWPGFKPTIPQPITIDGASGKVFELTSTKAVATCPTAVLWQTPQLTTLDAYPIVNRKPEQRASSSASSTSMGTSS